MKLEHPLIGMVIQKCVFLKFDNKEKLFCVGYPAIMALDMMEMQTLLKSLRWTCFGVHNIFLPLGKMIGMVRSRTSFILSSRFWEIGSPPTGGAGRMKLFCVVPSGGAGGIDARGNVYMGAPIGVVEIHLQLEIAARIYIYIYHWRRKRGGKGGMCPPTFLTGGAIVCLCPSTFNPKFLFST